MHAATRTALVIIFLVAAALLLAFSAGMMSGPMMSGGVMSSANMDGVGWMWLPALLLVLLAALLVSAFYGKK